MDGSDDSQGGGQEPSLVEAPLTGPGQADEPMPQIDSEPDLAEAEMIARGAYVIDGQAVYFDGAGWFAARQLAGGMWIPDTAAPVANAPVEVVGAEFLGSAEAE